MPNNPKSIVGATTVDSNFWKPLGIGVSIVSVIFILFLVLFADKKFGAFGDSFGILSSLFTGLAFAGVVAALWVQRQDLKLTQQELQKSVKAQQDMAAEMQKQLTYAKLSSDLELLNKYMAIVERGGHSSFGNAVKRIIITLTKELVHEPRFIDAITPDFTIELSEKKIFNDHRYQFNLNIVAHRMDIKIKELKFYPQPPYLPGTHAIPGAIVTAGNRKPVELISESDSLEIEITIQDTVISNTWSKKYNLSLDGIVETEGLVRR